MCYLKWKRLVLKSLTSFHFIQVMCTNLSVCQNADSVTPMKTNQPCLTLTKFASMTCKAMSKYHLPRIPDCSECCESIISGQMCCCSYDFAAYQLVSWKIADQSLVSTSDGWVFDFHNNHSFMFSKKIQNQRTTGPGISKTSKSCQVSWKN